MKEGREILRASGKPVNPEAVRRRERSAQKLFFAADLIEKERDPELESFLKRTDFQLLKNILQEIAEKSGINPQTLNFLGPDRILSEKHKPSDGPAKEQKLGAYAGSANFIEINHRGTKEYCEKYFHGVNLDAVLLRVICHEEIHATSKVIHRGPFFGTLLGYRKSSKGYKISKSNFLWEKSLFNFFNEGVTEQLAQEVFDEYIKRSGSIKAEAALSLDPFIKDIYLFERGVVNLIIVKLGIETGVPQETVWRALVRGLYEGEDLTKKDLQEFFSEIFGPEFMTHLANLRTPKDALELLEGALFRPQKTQNKKTKVITEWLKSLIDKLS